MKQNKILLVVPGEAASGGIKHYFSVLKNQFTLPVKYIYRGARAYPYRKNIFSEIKRIIKDYQYFIKEINTGDYCLVQTSTSLGWASVLRDGLFLYSAQRAGVKTIVFYRGWNENFVRKLEKHFIYFFKKAYFKADAAIVLSLKNKSKLKLWGYSKKIFVETTLFDEELLESISIHEHINKKFNNLKNNFTILFLARIEKMKGIYEAIEVFQLLQNQNKNLNLNLVVAGDGKELVNVRNFINSKNIENTSILGEVKGDLKQKAFLDADCYLFPSHNEGMPNSILEALAFGLPIVTSSVGAIPEIISEKNGFCANSFKSEEFANYIQLLIDNPSLRMKLAINNSQYAKERFCSSSVLKRLEKIYDNIIHYTND